MTQGFYVIDFYIKSEKQQKSVYLSVRAFDNNLEGKNIPCGLTSFSLCRISDLSARINEEITSTGLASLLCMCASSDSACALVLPTSTQVLICPEGQRRHGGT